MLWHGSAAILGGMGPISLAERLAAPGFGVLPVLEREVRDLMTPGVVSIVESAALPRVFQAFAAHRVHSVLVVGANTGTPLGWVTARGLLAWIDRDASLHRACDAVTERASGIRPGATGKQALTRLQRDQVGRLLVENRPGVAPEGVISDLDLVANAVPRR